MKKIIKVTVLSVLLIAAVVLLAGCGTKESKAYKVLSETIGKDTYVLTMEGEMEGMGEATVTVARQGEKRAMDMTVQGMHISVIYVDGTTYTIMHDEKIYASEEGENASAFDIGLEMSATDLKSIKEAVFETGKEEIDGKKYDTETYPMEDGSKETYFFEGDTLKYLKTVDGNDELLLKIIELSNKVDSSLFEVPSDYELYEY